MTEQPPFPPLECWVRPWHLEDCLRGRDVELPVETFDSRADDEVKSVRAYLVQPEVVEWQPIETAPRDGTLVRVYDPADTEECPHGVDAAWHRSEGATRSPAFDYWRGIRGRRLQPTHWMPLPEGPSKAGR